MITPLPGYRLETPTWTYEGKIETNYRIVAPCGDDVATYYGDSAQEQYEEYGLQNTTRHKATCKACAIVRGESKATVLSQNDIANLFKVGIDGKRSGTGNYHSENGGLTHYRTTEGIRTYDKVLIMSSQCWSGGFARCAFSADIRLPLSSCENNSNKIREIKILEKNDEYVLFSMPSFNHARDLELAYWLFGRDDNRDYLVRLQAQANTIKDALESLKPQEAKNAVESYRQGDLFFIPVDMGLLPFNPRDGTYEKAHMETREQVEYGSETPKKIKELKRPIIPIAQDNTRHEAQELSILNGNSYVKGWINHPQHPKIHLDKWCLVRQNTATQSIDTSRRTGGGD